MLNSLRRT